MSFERVCGLEELVVDEPRRVVVGDQEIALVRDREGAVFALGDRCTHGDISLSEGFVEDGTLECWAHGSRFSLRTGEPENLPAFEPVPVYAVRIEGDEVLVDPAPHVHHNTSADASAKENR